MQQTAIQWSASYAGATAWQDQLEVIRAVVLHLTPKEVQHELDVCKSTLSEALHERNDKRWAAEWTHILAAMLAHRYDDTSVDLLRRMCEAGLAVTSFVVDEPRELTPEQERDAYRVELARMGAEGVAAIDRVRGGAKAKRRR